MTDPTGLETALRAAVTGRAEDDLKQLVFAALHNAYADDDRELVMKRVIATAEGTPLALNDARLEGVVRNHLK